MAVKFDLYESPRTDENSTPLPHPKVIQRDVINTKNLCEQIHRQSTLTPADVAAVFTSLSSEMADAFKDGYSVHISGIGFFKLILKCNAEANPGNITSNDISIKSIKFTPDKEMMEKLAKIKFERDSDESHHSEKLDDSAIKDKLSKFFRKNAYLRRRDFEKLTGFNQSKAIRYIRTLAEEKVIKNIGTKYQPLYVKGKSL